MIRRSVLGLAIVIASASGSAFCGQHFIEYRVPADAEKTMRLLRLYLNRDGYEEVAAKECYAQNKPAGVIFFRHQLGGPGGEYCVAMSLNSATDSGITVVSVRSGFNTSLVTKHFTEAQTHEQLDPAFALILAAATPAEAEKPRVFLQAVHFVTWVWGKLDSRTESEMVKEFENSCPGVVLASAGDPADYIVVVKRAEMTHFLREDNEMHVASKNGDLFSMQEASAEGGVAHACEMIISDWKTHTTVSANSTASAN